MSGMFCLTFLLAAVGASALAPDFSPEAYAALPAWENPYVTSSNRLPARAVVVPCESREVAVRIAELHRGDLPLGFEVHVNQHGVVVHADNFALGDGAFFKVAKIGVERPPSAATS